MVDVSKGEADIAVRMGNPHDESLVGRRVGSVPFRLFAAPVYIDRHGCPAGIHEIGRHRVIECGGVLRNALQAKKLRELAAGARIATTLDDITSQAAAARAGLGLVALPPYLAGRPGELMSVLPDAFLVEVPIWILTRADLRTSRRINAVKTILTGAARTLSRHDCAFAQAGNHGLETGGNVVPIRPAIRH